MATKISSEKKKKTPNLDLQVRCLKKNKRYYPLNGGEIQNRSDFKRKVYSLPNHGIFRRHVRFQGISPWNFNKHLESPHVMVMSCTVIPSLKLYQLIFQSVGRQKLWVCTKTEPARFTCFEQFRSSMLRNRFAKQICWKSWEIKHNRNPNKDLSNYFYIQVEVYRLWFSIKDLKLFTSYQF